MSARKDEFELATAPDGMYHIATFPTDLTELDFRSIEYATIDGGIFYSAVQFFGPEPTPVPEPAALVLRLAAALLAAGPLAAARIKARRIAFVRSGPR